MDKTYLLKSRNISNNYRPKTYHLELLITIFIYHIFVNFLLRMYNLIVFYWNHMYILIKRVLQFLFFIFSIN